MFNPFIMRYLGAYYMLVGSMYFAFTGAFAKLLSTQMSTVEVVFFRNIVGLAVIIYTINKSKINQKGGKFTLLLFRGIAGMISILAFFYNIANIGLAEAFTFGKTSPIFISIIAAVFLKEKLSFKSWVFIFIGFLGIVCIMRPDIGFTKNDFMGICNGIFAALAYTSIHELRKYYDTKFIVLSFVGIGTIIPIILMCIAHFFDTPNNLDFMFSKFVIPDFFGIIYILCMGITGLIYQNYLTKSFVASKKAGPVAAIGYSDIIFTLLLGLMLGDNFPDLLGILGIILIIISGVIIAKDK